MVNEDFNKSIRLRYVFRKGSQKYTWIPQVVLVCIAGYGLVHFYGRGSGFGLFDIVILSAAIFSWSVVCWRDGHEHGYFDGAEDHELKREYR